MSTCIVEIREVLIREVIVEADSLREAEDKVREEWLNEKHVLNYEDFASIEFDARKICD